MGESTPDQTYGAAYNAISDRIRRQYAGERAGLNQQLASAHVLGSGVSTIPMANLGARQAGDLSSAAETIGTGQAQQNIAKRWMGEDYQNQLTLAQLGYSNQDAIARRMGQNQLYGGAISGALTAAGSLT